MSSNLVNVKIQFVGLSLQDTASLEGKGSLFTNKFDATTTIIDVLDQFQKMLEYQILNRIKNTSQGPVEQNPIVQILNNKASFKKDLFKSLKEYGIDKGSCVLRISFPAVKGSTPPPIDTSDKSPSSAENQPGQKSEAESENDGQNNVIADDKPSFQNYKPSNDKKTPAAADILRDEQEEDLSLTVEDAKKYQQLLKDKANAKSDYVLNKLRKEKEEKYKRRSLATNGSITIPKEVQLRIKFADGSLTQLKFSSTKTVGDLLQFINQNILFKEDFSYNLVIPKFNYSNANRGKNKVPEKDDNIYHKDVSNNNRNVLEKKILDYSQASFIFELVSPNGYVDHSYKGPFLKNAEKAETIDNLLGNFEGNTDSKKADEAPVKKKAISSLSSEKKIPKWLKLGKK